MLAEGRFAGPATAYVVNGPGIKASNTFETPDLVGVSVSAIPADGRVLTHSFAPHSVTALVCPVA